MSVYPKEPSWKDESEDIRVARGVVVKADDDLLQAREEYRMSLSRGEIFDMHSDACDVIYSSDIRKMEDEWQSIRNAFGLCKDMDFENIPSHIRPAVESFYFHYVAEKTRYEDACRKRDLSWRALTVLDALDIYRSGQVMYKTGDFDGDDYDG